MAEITFADTIDVFTPPDIQDRRTTMNAAIAADIDEGALKYVFERPYARTVEAYSRVVVGSPDLRLFYRQLLQSCENHALLAQHRNAFSPLAVVDSHANGLLGHVIEQPHGKNEYPQHLSVSRNGYDKTYSLDFTMSLLAGSGRNGVLQSIDNGEAKELGSDDRREPTWGWALEGTRWTWPSEDLQLTSPEDTAEITRQVSFKIIAVGVEAVEAVIAQQDAVWANAYDRLKSTTTQRA